MDFIFKPHNFVLENHTNWELVKTAKKMCNEKHYFFAFEWVARVQSWDHHKQNVCTIFCRQTPWKFSFQFCLLNSSIFPVTSHVTFLPIQQTSRKNFQWKSIAMAKCWINTHGEKKIKFTIWMCCSRLFVAPHALALCAMPLWYLN